MNLWHQLHTHDGHSLHYSVKGAGPVIVFLHGWTSSAAEWQPFADRLSDRYRVICWNARGHGLYRYAADLSMELDDMAEDLARLLTREAPDGAVVVGHSMGALTLWRYISHHGCRRLNGAVIIDQSPRLLTGDDWRLGIYGDFSHARNAAFVRQLREDFPQAVCRLIFGLLDQPDAPLPERRFVSSLLRYLGSAPAPLLIRCWESLTRADLRPALARITVPALLIYGGRSQFYGEPLARWVKEQIPDSRLRLYPDADHSPHMGERERFMRDLEEFLRELPQTHTMQSA